MDPSISLFSDYPLSIDQFIGSSVVSGGERSFEVVVSDEISSISVSVYVDVVPTVLINSIGAGVVQVLSKTNGGSPVKVS